MTGIPWLHDEGDGDWRIAKIDRFEAEGGPYPRVDAMKCAECDTPALFLRMGGVCPLADAAARCPHLVAVPAFTRADVGEDAYCDLLETIDPGAEL